jgi:hypothetical protein
VHEHRSGDILSGCFEEIQGTHCVDVKIVKRARSREIVARLGGRVHHKRGTKAFQDRMYRLTVPNVDLMVMEAGMSGNEPLLVPACVTLWSEKISAHVVIYAVDFPASLAKVVDHLGANQAGGTRHEQR